MHAHSTIQLGMCALVLAFDVEVYVKPHAHAQRQSQTKIQVPLQLIAGNCTAINYTYQN